MHSRQPDADRTETTSRRQFLATAAAASAGLLAGCGDITTQEFEADPVTLSDESQSSFELSEVVSDSQTITRQIDEVDGEVTITNQVAVYDRMIPAEPSLVDRFTSQVGVAPAGWSDSISGPQQVGFGANPAGAIVDGMSNAGMPDRHGPMRSAVVAGASDVGIGEVPLPFFEGEPTVGGDRVNLVVPAAAATGEGGVSAGDTIAMLNPPFTDERPVNGSAFSVPLDEAIPSTTWGGSGESSDSGTYSLGRLWPKRYLPDEVGPDTPVLYPVNQRNSKELFGLAAEEMPGEQVEGESFTGNNPFLVAVPGDLVLGDRSFDPAEVFDAGGPVPNGGASYGMGVLATPNAEFAGQSANPLTGISLKELLTHDMAQQMLANAGITEGESVEWRTEPVEIADVPDGTEFANVPDGTTFDDVAILDEGAETKTFAGVIGGLDHPWLVVVNLARAVPDDVVIAAGIQRTPVGSSDQHQYFGVRDTGNNPFLGDTGNNPFVPWVEGGRSLNAATFGSLE